jgi:hypothetical protein
MIQTMKRVTMNMLDLQARKLSWHSDSAMTRLAVIALWIASGAGGCVALAQQSAQPAFPSAAEATQRLFQAVQSNDEGTIANILGGPTELTSSRDPGQDKVDRELFVRKYQEMHRLGREAGGSVTLYIGAENWPFPIPLVEKNGAWRFDSVAGQKEVLSRRIGENELMAIANCHEFTTADKRPHAEPNPGDPADSSPASLVAKAASGSDNRDPILFHGYYFRLLPTGSAKGKTVGGFTLVAYPAEYRSSGVMTFIVTKNGVVYEKDLGANTSALAKATAEFHKNASWRPVDE